MRKLWIRRRAVSTMIGGVIVLALFLTALVAAIVLSQQYVAFESGVSQMEGKYVDRSAEKLVGTPPGVAGPYLTGSPPVNQYSMYVSNVAGIGSQIARIYINSSSTSRGCHPIPCVLDPSASIVANSFSASDAYINAGEFAHKLTLWLPTSIIMLDYPADGYGSHSVTLVTTRGGLFSFHFPFPPLHSLGGGPGGTGIFIGPLVMIFEPVLVSYTSSSLIMPPMPITIGGTPGWQFPAGSPKTPLIFFIKVYNQGMNPVKITAESLFQLQPFGKPSSLVPFWLVAPMKDTYCAGLSQGGSHGGLTWPSPASDNSNLDCSSSWSSGNTQPGAGLVLYDFTNHPYIIPAATTLGTLGKPVYLLFSADKGGVANSLDNANIGPVATFLELGFQYDDGTGTYNWGVNLPFISGCGGTFSSDCKIT